MGIWAQAIYPNVGGFGNQAFFTMDDEDLRIACVRAYNDWLAEFCRTDPARLKGVAMINLDDIEDGLRELERAARLGGAVRRRKTAGARLPAR